MVEQLSSPTEVEILKGLRVRRTSTRLQMSYRWFYGIQGCVSIAGEALLFVMGSVFFFMPLVSLLQNPALATSVPVWQFAITLAFMLGGLFVFYRGLGMLINATYFEIDSQTFKTRNRPLPLLGNKNHTYPLREITSVDWQKVGHTAQSGGTTTTQTSSSETYDVVATTTRGQKVKLLSALNGRDYAFAIQGELSRFLNLPS